MHTVCIQLYGDIYIYIYIILLLRSFNILASITTSFNQH